MLQLLIIQLNIEPGANSFRHNSLKSYLNHLNPYFELLIAEYFESHINHL